MEKVVSVFKANKIHGNNISRLTIRLMAVKLPIVNPLMFVNLKNERATRTVMGLSTITTCSTADQILTKDSSVVPNVRLSSSSVGDVTRSNPCLDLFFDLIRVRCSDEKAFRQRLEQLLPLAWSHNPLTTLKLICNILRNWHMRYEEETFYTLTFWLHQYHPKTLAANVKSIARSFVYVDHIVKLLNRLPECYERDPHYHLLHDQVSDALVEWFKSDIEKLNQRKSKQYSATNGHDDDSEITRAAECCLSMDGATLLYDSIARKIFPRKLHLEYQGIEEADYANRVRDRLRKEVLVPLEEAYNSPSNNDPRKDCCMVNKYLEEVKFDQSKIVPDALLPHEIVNYVNHWNVGQVAELQWKAMVEHIYLMQGKMNNGLVICDVHSMFMARRRCTEVLVAFTLLVSELNEDQWKGKVINFSKSAQLHLIQGDELRHKCEFVRRMKYCEDWRIDFQKVFDLILEEAVKGNLKPEQMIKRVFVFTFFSDFDDVAGHRWKDDYEAIQRKFKEKGYENAVPEVVYWKMLNIHPGNWVMPCTYPGVTLLSGTSDNLLKLFLDNGGEICRRFDMEAAISGQEYQKLVVVD